MRYAFRQLLKNPGFTAAVVLSLALGISVSAMMFSFFNAYLLRPVPAIKEPEQIIELQRGSTLAHRHAFSWHEYEQFRNHDDVFSGLLAYTGPNGGTLTWGDPASTTAAEEIRASFVSANYFSVLGVDAALGRTFLPEERLHPQSVVVLSYDLWQRKFAADPNLVGQTIILNAQAFTVVGIAPKDFAGLGGRLLVTDAWLPVQRLAAIEPNSDWSALQKEFRYEMAGRLKPAIHAAQAAAALHVIDAQVADPDANPDSPRWLGLRSGCTFMSFAENVEVVLPVLLATGLVLLIACANAANLLLARAVGRQKEMGIRLALGAGRGQIVRQLLFESVIIALLGGLLGLVLGTWAGQFTWSLRATFLPPELKLVDLNWSPDLRTIAYTLMLSLAGGIIFGLAPAIDATRVNLSSALKEEGSLLGTTVPRSRLRNVFAVAQIALCLCLLLGAGLLLRAEQRAANVDFGYETKSVVLMRFDLQRHGYSQVRAQDFQRRLMDRIRVLPGVQSLSLARHTLAGREHVDIVSPDYFRTMGIPMIRGRAFTDQDGHGAPVAIVSQAAAHRLWPGQDPLGRRTTNAPFAEIVGIVGNAKNLFESLVNNARPSALLPNAAFNDYLYLPIDSTNPELLQLQMLVRAEGEQTQLMTALRAEVRALDANLMASVVPLTHELAGALKLFRGLAGLAQAIGLVALLLATLGIYSVMAYLVSQRKREIGIRIALGARRGDMLRWALTKGARLVLWGLALGLPAGVALSVYLSSVLVGLRATEWGTFASVSLFLGGVALLACYFPARRATRVDPIVALRDS